MHTLRTLAPALLLAFTGVACGSEEPTGGGRGKTTSPESSKATAPSGMRLGPVPSSDFCAKLDRVALAATLETPTQPWKYRSADSSCAATAKDPGFLGAVMVKFDAGHTIAELRRQIGKSVAGKVRVRPVPGIPKGDGFVSDAWGVIVAIGVEDGTLQCFLGGSSPEEMNSGAKLCLAQIDRLSS